MRLPARLATLAVPLLLAALLPAPPAHAAGSVAINLVDAGNHGCSTDTFTDPDLRVTVRVDGAVVLQAAAQDRERPLYAKAVPVATPDRPVSLTVQVEEAEPGGFLGLGTSYVACDAAPGAADILTVQWSGEATTVAARGDGRRAAEATLVLGPGAPPAPTVGLSGVGADRATLSWDGVAGATSHELAPDGFGPALQTLPAASGSTTLDGLCDGQPHAVRVVRRAGEWAVAAEVRFVTANVAPAAPRILEASAASGALSLVWEEPTPHDVVRYDVHAGDAAGFAPGDATRIGSVAPVVPTKDQRAELNWTGGGHLRLVAVDAGGLAATSAAFRVGSAPIARSLLGREDCGPFAGAVPAPGSSAATAAPSPPPSDGGPDAPAGRPEGGLGGNAPEPPYAAILLGVAILLAAGILVGALLLRR